MLFFPVNVEDEQDVHIFKKNDKKRKKTSYSHGRKLGINVLSNVSSLPFQVIVFRAGWLVRNLHSAFDYIFNSFHKDDSCASALAGWLQNQDPNLFGGYTPSFDAIKTDKNKAILFVQTLFFHQKDHMEESVLKMLFASILRFYLDFESLLSLEPCQKYEGMLSI